MLPMQIKLETVNPMIDPELDAIMKRKMKEMMEKSRASNTSAVIVYSTVACPYCHMAKDYLRSKNIQFQDIDVGSDSSKAQEMVDKSGQMGVPVLDIKGKIIVGFNRTAIDEALLSQE